MDASIAHRLFHELPLGVLVCRRASTDDSDALILSSANPAAARMLSIDPDGASGKPLGEILPELEREKREAYANAAAGEPSAPTSHELVRAGRLYSVSHVVPGDGMIALLIAEAIDGRAREVTWFLDSIIENIPAMIFVKDADTLRFRRFNRAGEELLGMRREDLVGKSDRDFFPPEQAEFFQAKDRDVLANKTLLDIPEEPIDTAHGRRWLQTKKIPIADEEGVPRYLLGISLDITERKLAQDALRDAKVALEQRVEERTHELAAANEALRAQIRERELAGQALRKTEDQLRQAQKMEAVGRLAGSVAHDFNNMLVAIMSHAEFIIEQSEPGSANHQDAREIKEAAVRAAALTQQLLAFSRQKLVNPQVLDVNEAVRGIESMIRRLIGEDVELALKLAKKPATVQADRGHLDQVLLNLAVNARDAMPTGGTLTIETEVVDLTEQYAVTHLGVFAGRHVMIAVSDTGHGMPADVQERIFEPFFTTKPSGQGTGLGLSIVYGIVKQSSGGIWVYSELSRGTTFKIYLPVANVHQTSTHAARSTERPRGGEEVILLVEDEDLVRRATREILKRQGYSIIEARDPEEAILLCERWHGPIHAVVTDVVMPKLNGPLLVERLRQSRPELRVLFMSGYTDDAVIQRGMIESGAAFLQKPFMPDVLARRVRELLDSD